jgi:hypothetical protein
MRLDHTPAIAATLSAAQPGNLPVRSYVAG